MKKLLCGLFCATLTTGFAFNAPALAKNPITDKYHLFVLCGHYDFLDERALLSEVDEEINELMKELLGVEKKLVAIKSLRHK